MQDIARASGVSQSTVSRVLTGAPTVVPINPATRERVLEVARQMRYRPNPLARGLRGARTMLLGVIVREITDPFFAGAVDAISAEASRRGYNVVLGHAHGRAGRGHRPAGRPGDAALRRDPAARATPATSRASWRTCATRTSTSSGMWQGAAPVPGISTVNVDNRAGHEA